jgi:hypothetical protein
VDTHLSFSLARASVIDRVLVPKYYDPELALAAEMAEQSEFDLPELGDLLLPGVAGSHLGSWIPREFYGTGNIPFVRTSDLSDWRIRVDYKKGVSAAVYDELREKQDVQVNDLLLVAHGTYLVGTVAIITDQEPRLVLQDHIFRLRANPKAGADTLLLLAALSTAFVRRQVRARQFSADIIDKIGERHLGIRVPLPKKPAVRAEVTGRVAAVIREQSQIREAVRQAAQSDLRMTRERAAARYGFTVEKKQLRKRILIPKYYDPVLEADLAAAETNDPRPWVSLGELVERGLLSATSGVEVGKMAYGTGAISFIRTSDLADWVIKRDVRQGVSEFIYNQHSKRASVEALDVLLIRDGTYLVGSSALVTADDLPALFCGGIYRLRSLDPGVLRPHALLALINLPLVRRQMRARQFTRDVIDTLGSRLLEVRMPSPTSDTAATLAEQVENLMDRMAQAKREIGAIIDFLEPPSPPQAAGRPGWSMR